MVQASGCRECFVIGRSSAPTAAILVIDVTNERFLQYAQNMRGVMRKNARCAGIVNGQYICGFHTIGECFWPKLMQKSASSPLIAF
jgi:hypothetical protein